MRPSIAARSFCSFSTSKKPPQLANTRFQILGIGDEDFRWHEGKYPRLRFAQNVVAVLVSSTANVCHEPVNSRSPRRAPLQLFARGIVRFRLGSTRRLETENR